MSKNFELTGNYKESMEKADFSLLTDEELATLIEDYNNKWKGSSELLRNCIKVYTGVPGGRNESSLHLNLISIAVVRFIEITKNN